MKRILYPLLLLFSVVFLLLSLSYSVKSAYIVHSVNGKVKCSVKGKISNVEVGTILDPKNMLSIPPGASIQIKDDATNKLYSSVSSGNMLVSTLVNESSAKAGKHLQTINSALKLSGRGRTVKSDNRVYREKGMVTKSLNLFDKEAANIEISPDALALMIANTVYFDKFNGDSTLNFSNFLIDSNPSSQSRNDIGFKLNNPLETPVYFNILKFSGVKNRVAEISQLGQPEGFYVLPSKQTIWRTQNGDFPYGEHHLLIACHYSFNIDDLIEAINKVINNDSLIVNKPVSDIPVFIRTLN